MNLLLDEHIDPDYLPAIRRFELEFPVRRVGDLDAPKVGTKDPDILVWCEENNFALVTNNRKSMPAHLKDHLEGGRHVEGIFVINLDRGKPSMPNRSLLSPPLLYRMSLQIGLPSCR